MNNAVSRLFAVAAIGVDAKCEQGFNRLFFVAAVLGGHGSRFSGHDA